MIAPSYGKLVTTPQQHLDFLRVACDLAQKEPGKKLNEVLAENVTVAGAPFSQVKHLRALEDLSDDWNLASSASTMRELNMDGEAVPDDMKVEIVQRTEELAARDPGYGLAAHTTGYEKMTQDLAKRGVDMAKKTAPDSQPALLESPTSPSSQFLASSPASVKPKPTAP